jgi:hypothetical protein
MTKRNPNLPRYPRDNYATPAKAVAPVLFFLNREGEKFAEPCAGDGKLVRHLMDQGFGCAYAGDISTGQDAMAWTDPEDVDFICTNPPWDREVLHPLIDHLVSLQKPVWLLIDADWMHTQQAIPYLRFCTHIISIGRVRWIEGTLMDGYDNSCWYRFSMDNNGYPLFVPRHFVSMA